MLDDQLTSTSVVDQRELERRVSVLYSDYTSGKIDESDEELRLNREAHIKYLHSGLGSLPAGFISLDASRTWIVYWLLHSLALLDAPLPDSPSREAIIAFLASCQHPGGGFGGGPYQLPHLAPTYAAVCALVTLGGADALSVIDRPRLHNYLLKMCVPPERGGGMTMHEGGEVDVRGCYCALAVCHMLCLDKQAIADACDMLSYVRRCQSHEGGIGGEPWNEAHGGYAFCGLAAVALLGQAKQALDLPALLRWAVQRQGAVEGGFMGRTCKLVDGCYSLWQGGVFPVLHDLLVGPDGCLDLGSSPAGGAAASSSGCDRDQSRGQQQQPPLGAAGAGNSSAGGPHLHVHDSARSLAAAAAASSSGVQAQQAQQAQQAGAQGGQAPGASSQAGPAQVELAPTAERLADMLLAGGTAWVGALDSSPPLEVAEQQVARLQQQLDALVEASLEAEDALSKAVKARDAGTAAGQGRIDELKQEAVNLVERSAEVQQAVEHAKGHVEITRFSAALLLSQGADETGGSSGAEGAQGGGKPLLYNARALQLWLLKCCQGVRGGLKDKPGKPPDYYHTCYCLSGLSSSQHYSGVVLGGPANRLRRADVLCNVVEDKLAAARAFFS